LRARNFGLRNVSPIWISPLQVVDNHVHVGHGPGAGLVFLAVELGGREIFAGAQAHLFHQHELAFDEEASGAAAGVVDFLAGLGVHDARHHVADLGGRVEFAGALAGVFGELADEVFVAAADDVGLDVGEAEPLGADGLDEVGEPVVVEVALAVGGGVEVDAVDDALEQRIRVGDVPEERGKRGADLRGERADDGPDGFVGRLGLEREIETDDFFVARDVFEGFSARATQAFCNAVEFVVEDIAEPLGEDEREDEILVFGRILGTADGAGGIPDPSFEGFVGGNGGHEWAMMEARGRRRQAGSRKVVERAGGGSLLRRGFGGQVADLGYT
jgi:hypothetical protein